MSCFSPSCVKTHKAANSVACTQKRPLLLSLGSGSFQATWNSSLCWPEEKLLFRLGTKICHPNYSIRRCYRYNFSAFDSTFHYDDLTFEVGFRALARSPLFQTHIGWKASWTLASKINGSTSRRGLKMR